MLRSPMLSMLRRAAPAGRAFGRTAPAARLFSGDVPHAPDWHSLSDIDIANAGTMVPILKLAEERLGLDAAQLEPYGHYKAKIPTSLIADMPERPDAKLILVTAMTPTKAGEGKTCTSVGLADGLCKIGKSAMACLREPSLGPVFGMKGGAAGGGYAQVVPMADINLHFTGDLHAIGTAHNLLSALVDNHIYWGSEPDIDARRVEWRRVVDMNDRAMRSIIVGLGGVTNGFGREVRSAGARGRKRRAGEGCSVGFCGGQWGGMGGTGHGGARARRGGGMDRCKGSVRVARAVVVCRCVRCVGIVAPEPSHTEGLPAGQYGRPTLTHTHLLPPNSTYS